MIRIVIALIAIIIAVSCVAPQCRAQIGFDRRGGDYFISRFAPAIRGPAQRDATATRKCRAWSFSYPTAERTATCWLKTRCRPRAEDQASASGVRGTGVIEPRSSTREFSIDRIGGDYHSMEVPADPVGEPCKAACDADIMCRAWTYARPGYVGPDARCFLKDRVMPPRHRPCCISGVVR